MLKLLYIIEISYNNLINDEIIIDCNYSLLNDATQKIVINKNNMYKFTEDMIWILS